VIAILSVRTAVIATFDNGDVAREFVSYTPTSPDVPSIVARIDHLAALSGRGDDLRIQVDRDHTWPWAWYLRDYNTTFDRMDTGFQPEPGAILLISGENAVEEPPYGAAYQSAQRYTLRWWFPEDYRGPGHKEDLGEGIVDFAGSLGEAATWERWWGFWFQRDIHPEGGVEGRIMVPLEFEPIDIQTDLGAAGNPSGAPADFAGRSIIGGLGTGPAEMQNPMGVTLDSDGNIFVVDSDRAMVQKFDARGTLLGVHAAFGGEPGQFNQPSDLAVDAEGNVYVADTWNHRIQKLAPDLTPAGGWGGATSDLINPPPDKLWASRGIAIDRDGNVLVADSGTNRIRVYAPDGTHVKDFGRRGKEPEEFEEPTGVAVGTDGSVFVADAGNARIQKFDAAHRFISAWAIKDWEDRNPANKPQVEALPDGRVIATDPAHGQVLLLSSDGRIAARINTAIDVAFFSPNGVTFDPNGRFVYVTDGLAGHIRRFPFTDFALR
jgi:sugar lactone lactonase YvrE